MTALCRHCNKPESEHHEFEAYVVPVGCKCDPREWKDDTPLPICGRYFEHTEFRDCVTCQHPRECHGGTK